MLLIFEPIPFEHKHLKGWWDGNHGIIFCCQRKTLISVDFATISALLGEPDDNSVVRQNVEILLDTDHPLPKRAAPDGFATETQANTLDLYTPSPYSKQFNTPCLTINLYVENDTALLNQLTELLKDLPTQETTANKFLNLSLIKQPSGWLLQHDNKHPLIEHLTTEQTAPYLLDVIMTTYYREIGYKYAFHGSAVQWQERNLYFPAPSGSGKSTLFAHLTQNCKATPFSDEVIVLDESFNPIPIPFPMTLKTGSWPLFPDMKLTKQSWQRTDGRTLKYSFLDWSQPMASTKNIMVFPQYQAGQPGGIQQIGPCKAIYNLGFSGYEFCDEENESVITTLLEWLDNMAVYEMVYPSSEIAEKFLRDIL